MCAAHQLGQALADGQAQAGAAEPTSSGGVGLTEGLEQPAHAIRRDADARVAHGEDQQPAGPRLVAR